GSNRGTRPLPPKGQEDRSQRLLPFSKRAGNHSRVWPQHLGGANQHLHPTPSRPPRPFSGTLWLCPAPSGNRADRSHSSGDSRSILGWVARCPKLEYVYTGSEFLTAEEVALFRN